MLTTIFISMKKTIKTKLIQLAMLSVFLFLAACTGSNESIDDVIVPATPDESFQVEKTAFEFGFTSNLTTTQFKTNIPLSELRIDSDSKWCLVEFGQNNQLGITTETNPDTDSRSAEISISYNDELLNTLHITQSGYSSDSKGLVDIRIQPIGVKAFSEELSSENTPATHMIDGDYTTYFNAEWGTIDFPFSLWFDFDEEDIDYIHQYPKTSGKGAIGVFDLWVKTKDNPKASFVGEFDFQATPGKPVEIHLPQTLHKVTKLEFQIKSGSEDKVSCAEMEFYLKKEAAIETDIFTDLSCSELKKGVTMEQINTIKNVILKEVATGLYNGTYNSKFRVQEYRPFQHPQIMKDITRTKAKSLKDNPTGMYVNNTEEELIVFMSESHGREITLNIMNMDKVEESNHILRPGINIIKPSTTGLIYIYNHDYGTGKDAILLHPLNDSKTKDKTVKVHFVTGKVNGYFDPSKHDISVWNDILAGTRLGGNTDVDIVGKYTHVVWNLDDYRQNKTDILKMIELFDQAIYAQMEFTGLVKHKKTFNNRFYIHVNYPTQEGVGAYATEYRTAYNHNGYVSVFCTEKGFRERNWVIGHEIGHTNQVSPGVRWHGTTEVTNNICAMYNEGIALGYSSPRFVKDGAYTKAIDLFIKGKKSCFHQDPENNDKKYSYVTEKLIPFWQLKLYFVDILGKKDFYKDIYEHARMMNYSMLEGTSSHDGKVMLDFVKTACRIGERDLTEFFEQWGFLRPFNNKVVDYSDKNITVTQADIDKVKAEIQSMGYKKPNIGTELYYITDLNYKNYSEE